MQHVKAEESINFFAMLLCQIKLFTTSRHLSKTVVAHSARSWAVLLHDPAIEEYKLERAEAL